MRDTEVDNRVLTREFVSRKTQRRIREAINVMDPFRALFVCVDVAVEYWKKGGSRIRNLLLKTQDQVWRRFPHGPFFLKRVLGLQRRNGEKFPF